jgi:hypothetical protein
MAQFEALRQDEFARANCRVTSQHSDVCPLPPKKQLRRARGDKKEECEEKARA